MQKSTNIVALFGSTLITVCGKVLSRLAQSPRPTDQRRLAMFLRRLSSNMDRVAAR